MNSNKNYLLVVNPISGGVDKSTLIESIKTFALQELINLTLYETTGKEDELAIKNLSKTQPFERVLVMGGDGTIKLVAEALEGADVIFGIIPSGSANGLARDLNLPEDFEESMEVAFYGKSIAIDIILINGMKCLHLSDIGLNARLIKNYEEGGMRGKIGYTFQTLKTLSQESEVIHAVIETKDKKIETDASVIIIANSQKYGTGVVINPDSKIDDNKFEIVIFKELDWQIVGKTLLGNMPINDPTIKIISTSKARITTLNPVHFQIDGEYCQEVTSLDISILPNHIKIAIP